MKHHQQQQQQQQQKKKKKKKRGRKKRTRSSTDVQENPDNPSQASKWRPWKPAPKKRHVKLIHRLNENEIQRALHNKDPMKLAEGLRNDPFLANALPPERLAEVQDVTTDQRSDT